MSKYTAITRRKPSSPAKYLYENGYLVGECLDYGCGRGFDVEYYSKLIDIDGYDPNWFPKLRDYRYDTIMCNYVLNVVTLEVQYEVIDLVGCYLHRNGKAYFTVRRDIKKDVEGNGCIQRVVELPFKSLYRKSGHFEIYEASGLDISVVLRDYWTKRLTKNE